MGHSLRAGGEQVNTTTRKYAHATGEFTRAALQELEDFIASGETAASRRPGGVMSGPVDTIDGRGRSCGYDAMSDPKFENKNGDLAVTKRE